MITTDLNHQSALQCEENENDTENKKRDKLQGAKLCSCATRIRFTLGYMNPARLPWDK